MLREENLADKELVVGSIRVLGNMTGGGIEQIQEAQETLQNTMNSQAVKTEDYWTSLTADGVISAVEKKQLKKEYESLNQTHTALMDQAEAKGVDMSTEVIAYDTAFEELKSYLFDELKLFRYMSKSTPIESAEVFNGYYNDYYFALQNAQARVNIGESGKIREITSLTELGTDGEVVLFENNFYKYDLANHEWMGISVASKVGEYMGVRTSSPPQVLNQYFLVGPEGIVEDYLEFIPEIRASEENAWTDENGNIIYINQGFEIGYIYFWNERNEFEQVTDKNNWRYIVAMNDMLSCGYDVSPQLYEWLYGELAENIGNEVEKNVFDHTPKYERVQSLPSNPNDGDYILWDASSTSRFTKGHLYVYQKATVEWIELNPQDESGAVRSKFMTALADILEVNPTETGYFSSVFAGAFFTNTGTINSLQTSQLEIQDTGYIKSKGYTAGHTGWIINGNGKAQFSDIDIVKGYAKEEELAEIDRKLSDTNTQLENTDKELSEAQQNLDLINDNYIRKVDVEYALSDSETTAPSEDAGWSIVAPAYVEGKYMWQRTITERGNRREISDPTCISGAKGDKGDTGDPGTNGRYALQYREQYYNSTSKTEPTGGEWIYDQPLLQANTFLWTRTELTWNDGVITHSTPLLAAAIEQVYSDVKDAEREISSVKNQSIFTVDVEYVLHDSETTPPPENAGWSTTAPAYVEGMYMWQRTKIQKGNQDVEISDPTCISGAKGDKGDTGDSGEDGRYAVQYRDQYYNSTSNTELVGGEWVYDQPELQKNTYLWTRTELTWNDGAITHSTPLLAAAIEQVYSDVIDAAETLNQVTEKKNNLVYLKGELEQEKDNSDWALRTEGFDPETSTSGFGIRKNGNVYANNGVFRGTIESQNATLTGNFSIGTKGRKTYLTPESMGADYVYVNQALDISDGHINGVRLGFDYCWFRSVLLDRQFYWDGYGNLWSRLNSWLPYCSNQSYGHIIATGIISVYISGQSSVYYEGNIFKVQFVNNSYIDVYFYQSNANPSSPSERFIRRYVRFYSNGNIRLNASTTVSLGQLEMSSI